MGTIEDRVRTGMVGLLGPKVLPALKHIKQPVHNPIEKLKSLGYDELEISEKMKKLVKTQIVNDYSPGYAKKLLEDLERTESYTL